MARINIEDSLFKDDRFTDLVIKLQSRTMALGALVEAFILAQKFYLATASDRLIPHAEWARLKHGQDLIECGLAESFEGGVYVRGSENQFSWLIQRQEAGRRGGLAKSNKEEKSLAVASGRLAKPSGSKPLTLTLTKNKNTLSDPTGSDHAELESGEGGFNLEQIYQEYPRRPGSMNKGKGMARLTKIVRSQADFELALKAVQGYKAHLITQGKTNTEFVKMFSSFWDPQGDWKEWAERKRDDYKLTDELLKQALGGTTCD